MNPPRTTVHIACVVVAIIAAVFALIIGVATTPNAQHEAVAVFVALTAWSRRDPVSLFTHVPRGP